MCIFYPDYFGMIDEIMEMTEIFGDSLLVIRGIYNGNKGYWLILEEW
jgi:hypothetical protein